MLNSSVLLKFGDFSETVSHEHLFSLFRFATMKKTSLIFAIPSILNSILYLKKSEHLNFLDKLEQAKRIFKKGVLKLEQAKGIFEY